MSSITASRLQIVSPEGVVAPPEPLRATEGLDDLGGRQLAFVSNSKANTDRLFRGYDRILNDRFGISAIHERKPIAAIGAGPLIGELSARAHGIVTGMGD
jgi:hypothetical protein